MQTVGSQETSTKPVPRGPQGVVPLWFWAGVAVLFLFTVLEAWDTRILREEMRTVNEHATAEMQKRQQLQQELALLRREQKILTDPASVKIPLQGQNPGMPRMEAMWHSELGIVVSGQKITAPGQGHVLQLWLIPKTGSKQLPLLAARPEADGRFFLMVANPPAKMAELKALEITEEPAGGSIWPTAAAKWVGII